MGSKRIGTAVVAAAAGITAIVAGGGAAGATSHKPPAPFTSKLLVAQKSIGGITLGATPHSASRGFTKKECNSSGCSYSGHGYNAYFVLVRKTQHSKSTVGQITLDATKSGTTPATGIRTRSGIGLGSTPGQLKKAYKKLRGNRSEGFYLKGKSELATQFYFSGTKLSQITMENTRVG